MVRVHVEADVPDELVDTLLQALRDWEQQHPHVQMAVKLDAPMWSPRQATDILDGMDPPLPLRRVEKKPS